MLGDKMVYINDDKPIIRFIDGAFYVYGTPWNGKHHLDTDARAKIKAICEIRRGEKNSIERVSPKDMVGVVFNQTLRPEELADMEKFLALTDKLLTSVPLYRLHCNISAEAAELSYNTMKKGVLNED